MRYFTFWLFILLGLGGAGRPAQAQATEQVVRARIVWAGTVSLTVRGQQRRVPSFKGAAFAPNEQVGTYQLQLAGTVTTGALRDATYEALTAADARQLDLAALPTLPALRLTSGLAQHQPVTLLAVQPLRRNPQTGQAEKLVSFAYAYTTAAQRPGASARTYARASVLSQGDWYKIGVPASGIYKLDKKALADLGLNVQSLDPARLRLFGNAMGTLPQPNQTFRPDDLVENNIRFVGDANATFDDAEYFLFYARGPHTWTRAGSAARFQHHQNPYTDTAYYFLTVGSSAGRRVAAAPVVTGSASARITAFTERQFYERELVNLAKSGRLWLGEQFSATDQRSVSFTVPDLVPNTAVQVTSSVAAASVAPTFFQTSINGQTAASQVVPGYFCTGGPGCYPEVGNTNLTTLNYSVPASAPTDIKVDLTYNGSNDPAAKGYLDYLELNARRQLRFTGSQLEFRSLENIAPAAVSQFELANAAGVSIWDVTNPRRVNEVVATNGVFLARTDTLREFVAFSGSSFPTPRNFGRVATQNLHALNLDGKLELVILTHPAFLTEANRLAAHRTTHDGLTTQVVTTTQVFNEFGSGGQDVSAIRDFMKMVYDRAPAGKRQYLLLFGDASYDYKADPANKADQLPAWWKDRLPANADKINQNFVPVYESAEGLDLIMGARPGGQGITYSSDDYYGLLDDTEGAWIPNTSSELLDIGIGRLPVRTADQARLVIDKLIAYDSPTSYGKWRNRLSFVSDDGDTNLFTTYTEQLTSPLDTLATARGYNVYKHYLDMYPQLVVAAGQRSPAAEQAIDEAFEQGSLLINYIGHGGPKGWADEQILTNASVLRLQNSNRLAFLFTGTCDFSTYDNPEFTSAGEQSLTDITGGAIGLFTTTRVVYADRNQNMAVEFFRDLFTPHSDGSMPRMGDICLATKNAAVSGDNNRNYALLGDPSMRLAYPKQEATVTEINGKSASFTQLDTLKALQQVEIKGEVQRAGQRDTRFTGTAQIQVFEKKSIVKTLGNDPTDSIISVAIRENVLYDGPATVSNGQFRVQFVVPKDINYQVGLGKISLYAADAAARTDAHGELLVPIGDAAQLAFRDTIPPRIRLFMDNENSFVFGGLTGTTTTLIGNLRDESGINTAGTGIGHDLTATLDGDPSQVTILNEFYTAKVDSFQAGQVKYLFKSLSPGPHELRVKAWDTWNNSAERAIEFIAAPTEKLALQHVLNYPNPFATATTFHFDHNRQGEELEVQVQIFTVSGKLVRTLQASALSSGPHVASISWDGRDEYQDQLARGVYVYRVSVRSPRDGSTASKFEKLVLLN
ncbi:type IX secretion system sortase PorU [Hymenobacter sp. HSC-4F20]|uniref:type IX secretion system sortase PorU n=1 Tax=Hymenobacter sp. HSC-4F20 TaxID=2864135 RepID=UPI001C732014|nr:type IX secretion system sortase PorU [Hymenobacter sp. HSC-4F20]MBX0292484.1 type IX secretion system sortase PorU [Hymenobacter sp. HSC-4F20]